MLSHHYYFCQLFQLGLMIEVLSLKNGNILHVSPFARFLNGLVLDSYHYLSVIGFIFICNSQSLNQDRAFKLHRR